MQSGEVNSTNEAEAEGNNAIPRTMRYTVLGGEEEPV